VMKRILIERSDGGVSVMELIGEAAPEEEIAKWEESSPGMFVAWNEIDSAELPASREFRDAWVPDGDGGVMVDMTKARAIQMDRIRAARAEAFKPLDIEFMRAVERNDRAAEDQIAALKQRLRDLPQTFDLSAATTPEELGTLWPPELPA